METSIGPTVEPEVTIFVSGDRRCYFVVWDPRRDPPETAAVSDIDQVYRRSTSLLGLLVMN